MARSLSSQGDEEMVGSKGVIRKQEFIKIITRALYSLGYDKTGALLEEESGIAPHSSIVSLFMQQISDGKWDESLTTLHKIVLPDEIVKSASFVILEQKFLEFLRNGKTTEALNTLRNEIVPLRTNSDRVHELAACIICQPEGATSNCESVCSDSRSQIMDKLQRLLPASIMIPERRLEHLVEQALNVQQGSCSYHNTLDRELSLYTDHQCGKSRIPSQKLQGLLRLPDNSEPEEAEEDNEDDEEYVEEGEYEEDEEDEDEDGEDDEDENGGQQVAPMHMDAPQPTERRSTGRHNDISSSRPSSAFSEIETLSEQMGQLIRINSSIDARLSERTVHLTTLSTQYTNLIARCTGMESRLDQMYYHQHGYYWDPNAPYPRPSPPPQ